MRAACRAVQGEPSEGNLETLCAGVARLSEEFEDETGTEPPEISPVLRTRIMFAHELSRIYLHGLANAPNPNRTSIDMVEYAWSRVCEQIAYERDGVVPESVATSDPRRLPSKVTAVDVAWYGGSTEAVYQIGDDDVYLVFSEKDAGQELPSVGSTLTLYFHDNDTASIVRTKHRTGMAWSLDL